MPQATKSSPNAFVNSLGIKMVYVEPGTFEMGSPEDEEGRKEDETLHRVTLTKGYFIAATHVTQDQWRVVMGKNHSKYKNPKNPAEQVRWLRVLEFCEILTDAENKKGLLGFLKKKEVRRYRLPTEAEWEYACRAGSQYPFNCGRTLFTDQSNFDGTKPYGATGQKGAVRKSPMPVSSFKPNAWGIYDMHGNVADWCSDLYAPYSAAADEELGLVDPKGPEEPPKSGPIRVVRGGSFRSGAAECRSAARRFVEEGVHYDDVGLRLAMEIED